jgi:hypothetical protein
MGKKQEKEEQGQTPCPPPLATQALKQESRVYSSFVACQHENIYTGKVYLALGPSQKDAH